MAAFADESELSAFVGRDVPAEQARLLLELATAAIQRDTGQTLSQVLNEDLTLSPDGGSVLLLPQLPVTAVASVTVSGTVLTVTTDYTWTPSGILTRRNTTWGDTPSSVVVRNSHGYATIPGDIKAICLQAAARALENPHGAAREQVDGEYALTYPHVAANAGAQLHLLDSERDTLDAYRPVVLA